MQPRLFDPPEPPAEAQHPGQLPYAEWLKSSDTVYHSSFRPNWEDAPMSHVGTQTAASDRLVQSAVNISPKETDDPRGGRTYARRLTEPVAHVTKSDSNLNQAETDVVHYNREPEEVGKHAHETDRPDIQRAAEELREGRPVGYRNAFEDTGSQSILAPQGTLRAWHQDVMEAHSKGLDVHPHDVALAKQQFDPAIAVTPRSMGGNVESYVNRYNSSGSRPDQQTLLPYSTHKRFPEGHSQAHDVIPGSETFFELRPGDTETDRDNWGTVHQGRTAGERAKAHAETDPDLEQGFGVRDWGRFDWRHGPEATQAAQTSAVAGLTHLERAHHEAMDKKRPEQRAKLDEQMTAFHERNKHFKSGAGE